MKKLLLMLAAMAFIAVGCTDDPLEPENPGQDGTEQTPGTGDNGEEPGENPGGENPGGENPGGENPENPGENPEEPTLPGTEISLFDFAQLPNTDETLYRVSGVVWSVDVDENETMVILGTCLYEEDYDFDFTKDAVAGIINPTWLKDLNPALRPGHVLTVVGNKGAFGDDPDGDAMILNSQYVSHVDYSEPYLVFDMYAKPYLQSEAGEYTFNVYSNSEWTVTAPEGTSVTPSSGNGCAEVTFKYPANANFQDAFYPVVFNYSGKTAEIKFQQQAVRYSLELSENHVAVAADATTASVEVLSNGPWTVNAPEGVTATPESGNGNATVTFTFPENTKQELVQYVAQVVGKGNEGLEFVCEFYIDQAAAEKVLEDGKYWIVANNKVAKPLSGSYGYVNVDDAWTSASSFSSVEENAFTFKAVEGGYTIQDESGKYYYQTGTYNSFNVNASAQSDGSHIWTIEKVGDTYKIINNVKSKYIQFSTSYGNFGSYDTVSGDLPILVKVENAVPAVTLESSLTFEAEGGSQTITLPEGVSAVPSCDNAAFSVTASSNVVTVTAAATTEAQSGVLTLVLNYNGFAITKTVDLTQKAAPVAGETVVLHETFDKCKHGTSFVNNAANNSDTSIKTDVSGWTFVKGYEAYKSAKFGGGSAAGSATTPKLGVSGDMTVTFVATPWANDNTTLKLSVVGGGNLSVSTVTMKTSFSEHTVTITGATAETQLKFESNASKKCRFFLDDVKIVKN